MNLGVDALVIKTDACLGGLLFNSKGLYFGWNFLIIGALIAAKGGVVIAGRELCAANRIWGLGFSFSLTSLSVELLFADLTPK